MSLPSPTPIGTMRDGNRRSNYHCSLATTTGYFATRNNAGITAIHSAHPDKEHKIPAYGQLTFWSCASATDPSPKGQVTSIVCPGNHLTSLSVGSLSELRHLDCGFNDLISLDLRGLQVLETLILTKNRLASLDVRGLASLKTLDCYGNLLAALDLTGRNRLEILDCSMNQLISLKLGGCKSLQTIYAYRNQIAELDLSCLPALRERDFNANPIGFHNGQQRGMSFAIYHHEREYAREMGDPKLAEVAATSQEEAERLTAHLGMTSTVAVFVSPLNPLEPPSYQVH